MKWRAVLFDLDGTLLDTAPDLIAACTHTLRRYGICEIETGRIRRVLTAGMREMLLSCIPEDRRRLYDVAGAMRADFADYYTAHINVATRPFPGIEELMEELQRRAIITGVVTSKLKHMAERLLGQYPFFTQLAIVVGGDSVARSKPDPLPLHAALQRLELQPAEAIFVGDHLHDMLCANRAGVCSALAGWGYGTAESDVSQAQIDVVLEQPSSLVAYLDAGQL